MESAGCAILWIRSGMIWCPHGVPNMVSLPSRIGPDMAKLELTDHFVRKLSVEKRTDFLDAKAPGLSLRVSPAGTKSWAVRERSRTAPSSVSLSGHIRRCLSRRRAHPGIRAAEAMVEIRAAAGNLNAAHWRNHARDQNGRMASPRFAPDIGHHHALGWRGAVNNRPYSGPPDGPSPRRVQPGGGCLPCRH